MDDAGVSKLTAKLKEIFQKWQVGYKDGNDEHSGMKHGGISPMINKRLNSLVSFDSDEYSCNSPRAPHDVPKRYLAVYVGPELRRFIIPTSYLSHSLFKTFSQNFENNLKNYEKSFDSKWKGY